MQLEGVMWPVTEVPHEDSEVIPFNAEVSMRVISSQGIAARNVTWSATTLWRLPFKYSLDNIWCTYLCCWADYSTDCDFRENSGRVE